MNKLSSSTLRRLDALVETIVHEMQESFQRGSRPRAEEFLARYPELEAASEAALEVLCEEVLLRQEYESQADCADLLERFPQWRERLKTVLDCHAALGSRWIAPSFPRVGEMLGDFRLLAELGRGGRGRVYLAAQQSLADRQIVLKATPLEDHEHLTLARLQHTHIVPLYAVHDDVERGVRVLCFPYFGGGTLAGLLERLLPIPFAERKGVDLVRALRALCVESAAPLAVEGPACRVLELASYAQAICWIGACLADALDDAAQRGLVHLDVKPSNLLLTADGQPMLLDFHLARGSIAAHGPPPAWLGGTFPYMAPEQRTALAAVRDGRPTPESVDGRADIYALGLVLFEALGGDVTSEVRTGRQLRRRNPAVSRGLADILDHCLALRARDRYARAGDLAADLSRHLGDQPLRGVANRSLHERWKKWRRRQPHVLGRLAVALALLAVGAGVWTFAVRRHARAELALAAAAELLDQNRDLEAVWSAERGLAAIEDLPATTDLASRLQAMRQRALRTQATKELHQIAEQLRAQRRGGPLSIEDRQSLVSRCRRVWEERTTLSRLLNDPSGSEDRQMRADLTEILSLLDEASPGAAGVRNP